LTRNLAPPWYVWNRRPENSKSGLRWLGQNFYCEKGVGCILKKVVAFQPHSTSRRRTPLEDLNDHDGNNATKLILLWGPGAESSNSYYRVAGPVWRLFSLFVVEIFSGLRSNEVARPRFHTVQFSCHMQAPLIQGYSMRG
jgi:hypothetical protein